MRRSVKRVLWVILFATLLVGGVPWGLYWLGLHVVEGRPQPPAHIDPLEKQLSTWAKARGTGTPYTLELSPYTYLQAASQSEPVGLIAWWVATDYLREHQRYRGMLWRQLAAGALVIWITRHWTIEQLLSKARRPGDAG
jgi:hypothetical protein